MKVAIALIHYKAVSPTFLIVDMPGDIWQRFLRADQKGRQEMIVPKLKPHLVGTVRHLAWLPLDGQNKLKITDETVIQKL